VKFLTVDPGEHTGWSTWSNDELLEAGTLELDEFIPSVAVALGQPTGGRHDDDTVESLQGLDLLVIEDWALYPWKLQSLAWDKCRTARAIGALEHLAPAAGLPYILQPASIKDAAVAGGAEDLFYRPLHENRHQNDAIMHGVYFAITPAFEQYGGVRGGA
jgi:hypothetical protein